MLSALAPVVFTIGITFSLVGLLVLASALEHARGRRIERQVRLTNAIHAELGAVAAPTVAERRRGAWTVSFTAPFDRPSVVGRLVSITERVLGPEAETPDRLQIVIRPQISPTAPRGGRSARWS